MKQMDNAKGKVPPPILAIIHIIIAILLGARMPLAFPVLTFIPWLGLGLAAFGLVLGLMAMLEFKRIRNTTNANNFVSTGIYRFTRNPIYLGFVFMLIGIPMSMGSYWGIVLTGPLIVFMNNLVIKPEEANLEKRFKSQYSAYKAHVRRWL